MKLLAAALTVGVVAAVSAGVASANNSSYYPTYSYTPTYSYGYTPSYHSYGYTPRYSWGYSPSSYYGQLNGAGFPKNQWVRPYYRSSGTYVPGYWRNSPNDGLPTCRIIRC